MQFGKVVQCKDLRVGDIVRLINGFSGIDKPIVVGNPTDFRQSYDTMTVYSVADGVNHMIRPYIHLNADGSISTMGFEEFESSRIHGGLWYELLGAAYGNPL